MTRKEFEALVLDTLGISADYPFEDDPITGVFRRESGRWFAIAMNIPESRLGRAGTERIDVVNLKCAPEVIESLVENEAGIYRAYHMNKTHWLTAALDECGDDTLSWLLGISYELTGARSRGRSRSRDRDKK